MKLKLTPSFKNALNSQIQFIAMDKPQSARKFKNAILDRIRKIPKMPYSNRKSIFFEDSEIRDLVYKGYIVVYRVNKLKKRIEVFGFTKYQENPF